MITREENSDNKNTQKTSYRFWSRDLFCELKLVIFLGSNNHYHNCMFYRDNRKSNSITRFKQNLHLFCMLQFAFLAQQSEFDVGAWLTMPVDIHIGDFLGWFTGDIMGLCLALKATSRHQYDCTMSIFIMDKHKTHIINTPALGRSFVQGKPGTLQGKYGKSREILCFISLWLFHWFICMHDSDSYSPGLLHLCWAVCNHKIAQYQLVNPERDG